MDPLYEFLGYCGQEPSGAGTPDVEQPTARRAIFSDAMSTTMGSTSSQGEQLSSFLAYREHTGSFTSGHYPFLWM